MKNSLTLVVLGFVAAALRPLGFADRMEAKGGQVEQEAPTYPFLSLVHTSIVNELKDNDALEIECVNDTDTLEGDASDTNPLFRIADSVITQFSEYLTERGASPEAFEAWIAGLQPKGEAVGAAAVKQ